MAFERGNRMLNNIEKASDKALGKQPPAELGPSFDDIKDDNEFTLFLTSSATKRDEAFLQRYTTGDTTPADEKRLVTIYGEYMSRKENADGIVALLDDFEDDMLRTSPEFRGHVQANGLENVRGVLRTGLRNLAMKDPKKFEALQAQFKALRDFEDNVEKPLDDRIRKWCARNGVSAEDPKLLAALAEPDYAKRQSAIHDRLMSSIPTFGGHVWDWLSGRTRGQAGELALEDTAGLIAQRKQIADAAGKHAQNLLITNKEFREALARTRAGLEPTFKGGGESMLKFTAVKEFKPDQKNMGESFDEFLRIAGKKKGWTSVATGWPGLDDTEKEALRDEFWNGVPASGSDPGWEGYKDRMKPKGGGIMAMLFSLLFGKDFYKKDTETLKTLA